MGVIDTLSVQNFSYDESEDTRRPDRRNSKKSSRAVAVAAVVGLIAAGGAIKLTHHFATDDEAVSARQNSVVFPVANPENLTPHPPTLEDGKDLSDENASILRERVIVANVDYPWPDYLKPQDALEKVGHPQVANSLSVLRRVSYTEGVSPGFSRIGQASIIERNGELVVLTINHVTDDMPLSSVNTGYSIHVMGVGDIKLDMFNQQINADIKADVPNYMKPGDLRGDPNVLIPISYEAQQYLRYLQDKGEFAPLQMHPETPQAGQTLYVPSYRTLGMIEVEMKDVVGERSYISDNRPVRGQYWVETSRADKSAIEAYLLEGYGAQVEDRGKNLIELDWTNQAFVLEKLICTGFSGTPALFEGQDGNYYVVGTISNERPEFIANDGAECAFGHGVEPL